MTAATRMTDWYEIPDISFYGQGVGAVQAGGYGYTAAFGGSYGATYVDGFGGDSDLLFGSGVSGGWADVVNPEIVTAGMTLAAQGADFSGDSIGEFRHLYMSDCTTTYGTGTQDCSGTSINGRNVNWFGFEAHPGHYAPGFLGFTESVNGTVATGANQVTLGAIQSAAQARISKAVAAFKVEALKGLSSDWFVNKVICEQAYQDPTNGSLLTPAVRVNTLSVGLTFASRSDYPWNAELYSFNMQPYGFMSQDEPQYHHYSWVHTHGDMTPISVPAYAWRGIADANIPTDYRWVDLTSQLPHTWMGFTDAENALWSTGVVANKNTANTSWNQRLYSPGSGFIIGMFVAPDYAIHGGYPPWMWAGANGGLEYGPRDSLGFSQNKPVQALCYATVKSANFTVSVSRVKFELATNTIPQTITGGFNDDGRQFRRPR